MEDPSALLALLAAVFGAAAAPTFRKLSGVLFPAAALVIRTLPNAASGLILATEITHHDTSPVLHVLGMMSHREFLDKREDIEVVKQ